jgi:Flp pilus assembly secretin CpaC
MLARLYAIRAAGFFSFVIATAPVAVNRADEAERATPQKLIIEIKVAEINIQKLRNLGFDWAQISGTGLKKRSVEDVIQSLNREPASSDGFAGFLDVLAKNGLGRILAEPTIAT